jgi:hypothetical protein
VVAGQNHSCGVRPSGSIACWGDDSAGEASPPAAGVQTVAAQFDLSCNLLASGEIDCFGGDGYSLEPASGQFTDLALGYYNACGVRTSGEVDCWGDDVFGESSPPLGAFTSVSTMLHHSCGVRVNGEVACWGADEFGESSPPPGTFSQVAVGTDHSCALSTTGAIECWGAAPASQAPTGMFVQVAAGVGHSCAVRVSSEVVCWGYNFSSPPQGSFARVATGDGTTCGLRMSGAVECWGYAGSGALATPPGGFEQISVGWRHACAVDSRSVTQCWGKSAVLVGALPPAPPTGVSGVAGDASATVTWSAPEDDGGALVTAYTVIGSPGGASCSTSQDLFCSVTGLENGVPYTFAVTAANVAGSSDPSVSSAPVTPQGPPVVCGPPPAPGPFPDVPASHHFCVDIDWISQLGVVGGFLDGTFRPSVVLSRGSIAAMLYRNAGSPAFGVPEVSSFVDVPTSHVFFAPIEWAASVGIVTGFGDETFRPGGSVSRGSVAAMLYRNAGSPTFGVPEVSSFVDVPTSHVFFAPIEWAASVGIVTGFGDGTFRPGGSVTRGGFAALLHRASDS